MKTYTINEAGPELGELVEKVTSEGMPVVFVKKPEQRAVLITEEDYRELCQLRREKILSLLFREMEEIAEDTEKLSIESGVVEEAIEAVRKDR
ncbi:MAG: hypothetical protein DRQ02_05925 [Candidatus Latescibacterota bacterium]|nr:MAG: hypothetical protein DRQ02_05925 [Candidatus Latescibacterota bacterium]